jgi:hypothetical protein
MNVQLHSIVENYIGLLLLGGIAAVVLRAPNTYFWDWVLVALIVPLCLLARKRWDSTR